MDTKRVSDKYEGCFRILVYKIAEKSRKRTPFIHFIEFCQGLNDEVPKRQIKKMSRTRVRTSVLCLM